MKLNKLILKSFLALNVSLSFATEPEIYVAETASHFNARENQIYQENESVALDRIFENNFSGSASIVTQKGSYHLLLGKCSSERAAIAQLCVEEGATSPQEALSFQTLRKSEDDGQGVAVFFTPLVISDNQVLYKKLHQNFILGEGIFNSAQATLHYMTHKEKRVIEASRDLMVARIQRTKSYDQFDRDFMRESAVSETNCFESLIMTEDTSRLFAKHPELGTSVSIGEQTLTRLKADVVMATLRFSASLSGAADIPLGSANCLARCEDPGYRYYDYFVLDHVRSHHIDALLDYAEKHWQSAIHWNRDKSSDLKEALALSFWGQTIATPYKRGSESIAKWVVKLTTRYHGQELVFQTNFAFRMPFAMSPEDFVDYFKENVALKSELAEHLN